MKRMTSIFFLILITMLLTVGFTANDAGVINETITFNSIAENSKAKTVTNSENILDEIPAANAKIKDETVQVAEANKEDNPQQVYTPLSIENTGENIKETDKPAGKASRVIDPQKPMVALTFDDGPHPKYTAQIIDELNKYNSSATFFVLGSRVEKYPDTLKKIIENGNQIGNHTYDHIELTKLDSVKISDEINRTTKAIYDIVGSGPEVVRPSYGSINGKVITNTGMPLILWSVDTRDWKTRDKNLIVNEALKKVKDGDIILMHDIYKTTADAAAVIIKELSSRGYQLVTINELYAARDIPLETGKLYCNGWVARKGTAKN